MKQSLYRVFSRSLIPPVNIANHGLFVLDCCQKMRVKFIIRE